MNVLSTTKVSRNGNDCLIEESYSLVECLGLYSVIRFTRIRGWWDKKDVTALLTTTDKTKADEEYKKYCKYYKA